MASDVQDEPIVLHTAQVPSTRLFFDNLKTCCGERMLHSLHNALRAFAKLRGDCPDHEFKVAHMIDCGTMAVHRGVKERTLGHMKMACVSQSPLTFASVTCLMTRSMRVSSIEKLGSIVHETVKLDCVCVKTAEQCQISLFELTQMISSRE
jgi:hypothetical protein